MKLDLQDVMVIFVLIATLFCCYAAYEIRLLKEQTFELKGGYEYLDEVFELELKQ